MYYQQPQVAHGTSNLYNAGLNISTQPHQQHQQQYMTSQYGVNVVSTAPTPMSTSDSLNYSNASTPASHNQNNNNAHMQTQQHQQQQQQMQAQAQQQQQKKVRNIYLQQTCI